jgi:hypothetical protein
MKKLRFILSVCFLIFVLILSYNIFKRNSKATNNYYCDSYKGTVTSFSNNIKGYSTITIDDSISKIMGGYLSVKCNKKLMVGDSIIKKRASLYLRFYRNGELSCVCDNNYYSSDIINTKCDSSGN